MTTRSEKERQEAIEHLRAILHPGDTVYTVLRHVSRSGMYRAIDLYIMQDNQPVRITSHVCRAGMATWNDRHQAAGVTGCGMDAGFSLVYNTSAALFRDGFDCLGEHCPSNDHTNAWHYRQQGLPVPTHHAEGGYALRHEWM